MQLRHGPDAKITIEAWENLALGGRVVKNQDSTAFGTSGDGYGLPLWAAEHHSLADHRSVAPCGNYGERIRVESTTAYETEQFPLLCLICQSGKFSSH